MNGHSFSGCSGHQPNCGTPLLFRSDGRWHPVRLARAYPSPGLCWNRQPSLCFSTALKRATTGSTAPYSYQQYSDAIYNDKSIYRKKAMAGNPEPLPGLSNHTSRLQILWWRHE
jgi:hypothetical protein